MISFKAKDSTPVFCAKRANECQIIVFLSLLQRYYNSFYRQIYRQNFGFRYLPTEKEGADYMKFRKTENESKEWDELGGSDRYEFLRKHYDWRRGQYNQLFRLHLVLFYVDKDKGNKNYFIELSSSPCSF